MARMQLVAIAAVAGLLGCARSRTDVGGASGSGTQRPPSSERPSALEPDIQMGMLPADMLPADMLPASDCGGPSPATTRIRYAFPRVPAGAECESEVQERVCELGTPVGWTGAFEFADCEVDAPGPVVPVDDVPGPDAAIDAQAACGDGAPMALLTPLPGERCYAFRIHDNPTPEDTTPFRSNPGESYHEFYFAVPWPAGSVATRIASVPGSPAAYFQTMFASRAKRRPGDIDSHVIGIVDEAVVLDMGLANRCPRQFPADVGLALPDDGLILLQWHMYNVTGATQSDDSTVQVCTMPATAREHVGDLVVLGTELLGNGPLGFGPGEHASTGDCRLTTNGSGQWPARLVSLAPHLRDLGIGARVTLRREGGDPQPLLDVDYDPGKPIPYDLIPRPALQLGDVLSTTCLYDNDTGVNIPIGQSRYTEFCYVLALSYPAGLLAASANVPSLLNADNMCW